jgi:hypothetical protein
MGKDTAPFSQGVQRPTDTAAARKRLIRRNVSESVSAQGFSAKTLFTNGQQTDAFLLFVNLHQVINTFRKQESPVRLAIEVESSGGGTQATIGGDGKPLTQSLPPLPLESGDSVELFVNNESNNDITINGALVLRRGPDGSV